jgi:hypothetical protein
MGVAELLTSGWIRHLSLSANNTILSPGENLLTWPDRTPLVSIPPRLFGGTWVNVIDGDLWQPSSVRNGTTKTSSKSTDLRIRARRALQCRVEYIQLVVPCGSTNPSCWPNDSHAEPRPWEVLDRHSSLIVFHSSLIVFHSYWDSDTLKTRIVLTRKTQQQLGIQQRNAEILYRLRMMHNSELRMHQVG